MGDEAAQSVVRQRTPIPGLDLNDASAFVGVSEWSARIRGAIVTHARHIRPLVIAGQAGTGKTHVARLIHALSARSARPFQTVHCRDISTISLEAAIFGEVRKSKDGTSRMSKGAIALAEGGTLFLHHFVAGNNPVCEQLRRFLLSDTYHPLGTETEERADVRVIIGLSEPEDPSESSATFLRELETLGDFIPLIPLRERREDIAPLAQHFLNIFCERHHREARRFGEDAEQALAQYDWPGNVTALRREVEHVVSRLHPTEISASMVLESMKNETAPSSVVRQGGKVKLSHLLARTEREIICEALRSVGGRQNQAAKLLGISNSTLSTKLSKLGINSREYALPAEDEENRFFHSVK